MPRPRTPTALLELRGTFKRNPSRGRQRAGEPRPTTPLPGPPVHFTKEQKAAWVEIARYGTWLTSPDQFMLAIAVVLLDKHRRRAIDYKEIPHLISVLSLLGFNPRDRAKMNVPASASNDSPFVQFA